MTIELPCALCSAVTTKELGDPVPEGWDVLEILIRKTTYFNPICPAHNRTEVRNFIRTFKNEELKAVRPSGHW
jgi:hypothetical protein